MFNTPQKDLLPEDLEAKVNKAKSWLEKVSSDTIALEKRAQEAEAKAIKAELDSAEKIKMLELKEESLVASVEGLGESIKIAQKDVTEKQDELNKLNESIRQKNVENTEIMQALDEKRSEIEEKEKALEDKGRAIDVYANSLKTKEMKLTAYLKVFEKMGQEVGQKINLPQ